jgi:hypothetical protein
MKEDFLHYVWQYKQFNFSNLYTVQGEQLIIFNTGQYLQLAGPDFFNALIQIGHQKWAGNIEIHIKSSDWYLHQHEKNKHYDSVILHVVWENDIPIFREDNSELPTLELKNCVSNKMLQHYLSLAVPKSWIYCEKEIQYTASFELNNWLERLYFERLAHKSESITALLNETQNDWEAVLFCMLAKNFGLNTNGEIFLKIAKSIPFSVIRKECFAVESLEALFLGLTDLIPLEPEDVYTKSLQTTFDYLRQKYQLKKTILEPVQFFKHRPDNFPTIRLAQLAMLYHKNQHLFSKIINTTTLLDFYQLFGVSVSNYWQHHYQFDKLSTMRRKPLTHSFIDLVILNTILPIQFAYAKSQGKEITENILELLQEIKPEKNAIIEKFTNFGVIARNAFQSQALLELKNEYCNKSRCLECSVGVTLLKQQ